MLPVIAVLLGLTYWNIGRGFHRYVRATEWASVAPLAEVIEAAYGEAGGWDFLPQDPRLLEPWLRLGLDWARRNAAGVTQGPPPRPLRAEADGWPATRHPPPGSGGRSRDGRAPPTVDQVGFIARLAFLDAAGNRLAGPAEALAAPDRRPLHHDGRVIGYLALQPGQVLSEDLDSDFLATQAHGLVLITLLALVLSGLAGGLMATHLRRPIRDLVKGTAALAAGAFATRLPEGRRDELGELAQSFNRLGEALLRHEQARREWVAASSHELRTPISVLRAQIEAMQDGIRPTDQTTLAVLHGEVLALSKLVEDLHTLARADVGRLAYQFVPVEPLAVLDEVAEAFAPRLLAAGLALRWTARPSGAVVIDGDVARLRQLFANLLENALRYTDADGRIEIAAAVDGPLLRLTLDDTPPGVRPDDLHRLFDRFFRGDSSRNRDSGGSGLGLAICQGIAAAHDGAIAAAASPLGGLRILLTLPLSRGSR